MNHTNIKTFSVSAFHHFKGENYSRQEGNAFKDVNERIALAKLMCGHYDYTRDGAILSLEELKPDDVTLAVKERTETWEILKAEKEELKVSFDVGTENPRELTITPSDRLVEFESLYVKNGKIIPPKYRAVYAFRRFSVLIIANAMAKKLERNVITEVPANIVTFKDKLERMQACILENTKKNEGVHRLDWNDLLSAAQNIVMQGGTQNDLRTLFKAGTGQKLWWIVQCNARTLDNALINRIKSGELKVTKSAMEVKEAFDALPKAEKGENGLDKPLDVEMVVSALSGEESVKALSMTAVRNIAKTSLVDVFKAVCNAIASGDVEFFNKFHNDAEKVVALNAAFRKLYETK